MGTLAVLHFHDGVIVAQVDDLLFLHLSVLDVVDKCPADATAGTSVDEAVLRTCVESVLSVDKLRVQHDVALLALGFQVWQAFPVDEVLRAGNAGSGCCGTQVTGQTVVVPLCAEHAVDPSVFVGGETHVIDIGGGDHILGHGDGLRPEMEVVYAVGAFGNSEEALAVGTLHTHDKQVFAMPLDGSAVERGVHHDALHQVGIILLIEVVAPLQRRVLGSENRIFITCVDAVVPFLRLVLAGNQFFMVCAQLSDAVLEFCHL